MASAELFDDPFDVEEYVERLAWRTPGGGKKDGEKGFDPMVCYVCSILKLFWTYGCLNVVKPVCIN